MAFGLWDSGLGLWDLAFGIWDLAFGIWSLALGLWRLAFPPRLYPNLPFGKLPHPSGGTSPAFETKRRVYSAPTYCGIRPLGPLR